MAKRRVLEQHIAVFGESGSGKTVLVSSFYGAAQEPGFSDHAMLNVVASDIGQGNLLHRNYLGMRDQARVPEATRFAATSYGFTLKLKDGQNAQRSAARSFDSAELRWHDYPGEWFEQGVSGEEEARRRVDTFRALLGSDVALVFVDGQRLLDNKGEEERYLKSLLGNLKNGLLSLKDDLLPDGKPLVVFPRIWVMALSKADLLPEMDVYGFRDLLVLKAAGELNELREVITGFIEGSQALSIGEDFLLLSSAQFEPGEIDVKRRVGVDLMIPLASMLPFERHARWASALDLPRRVSDHLAENAGPIAAALIRLGAKIPRVGPFVRFIPPDLIAAVAQAGGDKVKAMNHDARSKHDGLSGALTQMRIDLDDGEGAKVLLRSKK
ncbi:ATP/GTP-binding protein [Demequina sp.]|uniref:ATP/GTP-binding protein n=1 Tax=Demequina sp. TaxID=2050685 RepID=UPI003A8A4257